MARAKDHNGVLKAPKLAKAIQILDDYFRFDTTINWGKWSDATDAALSGLGFKRPREGARVEDDTPECAEELFTFALGLLTQIGIKNSNQRLVLIPFPRRLSAEFETIVKGLEFMDENVRRVPGQDGYVRFRVRDEDVVFADSPNLRIKLEELKGLDSTLYIMGHCEPGGQSLKANVKDDGKDVEIFDAGLIDLLQTLSKSFQGKIKIYACNSSSDLMDGSVFESFTQQFADAMDTAGYKSCRFFGYDNELRKAKLKLYYVTSSKHSRNQVFPS